MRVMGVRELKESLSETLREVSRGEHVRVTLRGRAVAELVPAGSVLADPRVSALVADGRVTPAAVSKLTRLPPLAKGTQSASSLVLAERDDR